MQKINRLEHIGALTARFSIHHRLWLLPLFVITCIAISYGASTLRFAGDYRVFFGAENPDFIANENAQATFGKPDNIAFIVIPNVGSIYTPDTLAAVFAITEQSWTLPYVSRVDSLTNFQHTQGAENDLIVEDLLFDPADLTPEKINQIQSVAEAEPLLRDFIVSSDGQATLINVTVQLPTDVPNVAMSTYLLASELRDQILQTNPDLEIHLTGVASLSAAFEQAGITDSSTLIPAVYGFILLVILIALRSVSAMVSALLVIILATLVGMGTGGFSGVELTPISLAAPTIILTIAVADAIHVIASTRTKMLAGLEKKQAIIEAISLNFAPIGITSLTTIIGFLTLNFSDSPPFHHLGNMSAAGIAAAWILSVTFLPALLSTLPIKFKEKATETKRISVLPWVRETVIKRPGAMAASTLGFCVVVISFIPTLTINDQWSTYFDDSLEFRQAILASDPYFGSDSVEFIFDPGEPGAVTEPNFLVMIDAFTAWLRTQDQDVAHVFSLSDIMKRLNMNLNGDDPSFYALPQDRALASQYLLVYELSLPYGLDLNNRVDIDRQSTRVTASMRDISTNQTKDFIARAEAWFADNGQGYSLEITGSKILFSYVAQRNIEAVFEGAFYLIGAIFIILALSFRSFSVGLLSLVPNVLPLLAAFGVWALLVGVVGFSVAAVGAVAVGLIVDYTVHFQSKYFRARKQEGQSVEDAIRYAFDTAGVAIFLTTLILVAGFSILVTSTFKLNADMGLLTATSVLLAMIINFTLLPAVLMLHDRATNKGSLDRLHQTTIQGDAS